MSSTGHDPAVAIVDPQGQVVFAEATERFLQDKRAWGAMPDQINHIKAVLDKIIAQDSSAQFQLATTWVSDKSALGIDYKDDFIPKHTIKWMAGLHEQQQAFAGHNIKYALGKKANDSIWKFDHHLCHAASAVYSAPFDNAACVILDGEGEVGSASLFKWSQGSLKREWRSWGPGSLGSFYAWLTDLCGFSSVKGEEWKVMGLAAYGKPNLEWVSKLSSILEICDGRIRWSERQHMESIRMYFESNVSFQNKPYMEAADLAASAQEAYSFYARQILNDVYSQTKNPNLILSGGCALNSAFNGTILATTPFENVHVPSAPADDGNAIGAAILAWHKSSALAGRDVTLPFNQVSPYLGTAIVNLDNNNLQQTAKPCVVTQCETDGAKEVAQLLATGSIVGVMHDAAEFGPRALGNRSILADPRSPEMKVKINALVKGREAYRPFAPVIPLAQVSDWFEQSQPSPYMSFTLRWKTHKKSQVPAVVHEDGTGRLQTVNDETAPWLNGVVNHFAAITGVPVLLNTSFNVMGKPIVHSVNDALSVFLTTGLDAVLIGRVLITKV
jgi:carbamoyltransferase